MRIIYKVKFYVYLCYSIFMIYVMWPDRFAKHYDYISHDKIYGELVQKTTKNLSFFGLNECDYTSILKKNSYTLTIENKEKIIRPNNIKLGGEYVPDDCSPKFSTAIIVIYRQRELQLKQFLIYMHNFLRQQNIHYRIIVVEQYDTKKFNRAKLFNIGAVAAMKLGFPCLVLHDVDLLPLHLGQIYACTRKPRHMCSSLDQFRFNLPYLGLFGGVISLESETYLQVNGMSNLFEGWGGEDDDFFRRLEANNIDICRFEPAYSRYTMLKHAKEQPNADRLAFLQNGSLRFRSDGLNSLAYEQKGYILHNLYTHLLVVT